VKGDRKGETTVKGDGNIMTSMTMIGALALVPALARIRSWENAPRSTSPLPHAPLSIPTDDFRRAHHVSQGAFGCSRAQASHGHCHRGTWAGRQRGWLVRSARRHGCLDTEEHRIFLAENWRRRSKFEEVSFIFPNAPSIPITLVRQPSDSTNTQHGR
jgi:hypothetical protein